MSEVGRPATNGLDAVFIAFPDYAPALPENWAWPLGGWRCCNLGHAGALVIEQTNQNHGTARYYEFGRYANARCDGCGGVRRSSDYAVETDASGQPTEASLKRVLRDLSKSRGAGGRARAIYVAGGSPRSQRAFGDTYDPTKGPYDFTKLNCATWAWHLIQAGGVALPPMPGVPSPNKLADTLKNAGHRETTTP
jgi:hypothetical protein